MFKRRLISSGILIILLLVSYNVYAQYTITGGTGTPMLAEPNTGNDIDVYLVYGMSGVEIGYSSSSSSHQWFRYKSKALEAEPVTAQQNGTTSVISNPEEGYGYFVKETSGFTKYVWLIDYSKYKAELNNLRVSGIKDDCGQVKLEGDGKLEPMYYYTPRGTKMELVRLFELKYNTEELRQDDLSTTIIPIQKTDTIKGYPFGRNISAPYTDTEFTLKGDMFARHFNMEQQVTSEWYTTTALLVAVDTTYIDNGDGGAKILEDGIFSAPLDVRFTAVANEPVANAFTWKIYSKTDPLQNPAIYRGSEVEHLFDREGTFAIELQVLDRTGQCETVLSDYEITISEFYWDAPNVFSPGASPGINDEFKIRYKSITSFKGWIFNRWGNEMFYWTNPDLGWDGKKGGKYVAPGVYFYILEAKGSDGKTHKKKGSISILRSKTERNEIIE
ncbi:T9SS type B sorting domain-containing protein [Massilibacteroides vaginae]|uniref:T9SS type B sorting domain-containing protein n=1 Tax=Massilibacteroides vaginae TaxID=1673718 RepID=UPI000A1C8CC0|nr:gliding motility-associated C-terminal domain-containing protein [Massilibacteroides vaginae]